ncbi:GNAT family N-acetyltransferase [Deinococcus malanensis]|uniref:GNAT family N-acetyltransferase n=1 Tax=Deinococcus malanensis TaxID=1706855 RepID=UPI0036330030
MQENPGVDDVKIREACQDDLPALLGLYRQLRTRHPLDLKPAHMRAWKAMWAQPGLTLLLAETGGRPLGTLTLALIPGLTYEGRPSGVIESVGTEAAVRGQGWVAGF